MRLFAELQKQTGLTIVMVTHDLNLLHPVFDQVFAMRCGSIAASGAPAQVMQDHVLTEIYDDPFVHAGRVNGQICVWSGVRA